MIADWYVGEAFFTGRQQLEIPSKVGVFRKRSWGMILPKEECGIKSQEIGKKGSKHFDDDRWYLFLVKPLSVGLCVPFGEGSNIPTGAYLVDYGSLSGECVTWCCCGCKSRHLLRVLFCSRWNAQLESPIIQTDGRVCSHKCSAIITIIPLLMMCCGTAASPLPPVI